MRRLTVGIAKDFVGKPSIAHPDRLYIGGSWVKPSSDARIDVIAPATEELFFSVAEAQEADVSSAVAAALEAFDRGSCPRLSHHDPANDRRAVAHKLAQRPAV